jgi:HK97 family phage major capsid protein
MSEHAKAKVKKLNTLLDGIAVLTTEMEADGGKGDTPENREKLSALLNDGEELRKSIEQDQKILGLKGFVNDPFVNTPAGHDGAFSQPFTPQKSIGEQFIESEEYKRIINGGKIAGGRGGANIGIEAKGFLFGPNRQKATFGSTSTGLDTTVNYVTPPGGMVMVEQQRLYIRDLLSVGETTMASIPYIKETSFTNAADMVAEEGEKPEATLATDDATAPVKKIAVVLKVTDEMFADFPMLRDYINGRLRFMVLAKEEQQLLNGTGAGNQITGILQTSGIQTQAKGSAVPAATNLNAVYNAITKIRTVGFFEPDGIVVHPTDYQLMKLTVDLNGQYFGGGPFTGAYGNGGFIEETPIWGLRPVVTTAIAAGTALVGAFRLGAQIWQRQGITVDSTNSNEDDFNFNRVSLRVEERLALAVYRPLAFCTVTGIA